MYIYIYIYIYMSNSIHILICMLLEFYSSLVCVDTGTHKLHRTFVDTFDFPVSQIHAFSRDI